MKKVIDKKGNWLNKEIEKKAKKTLLKRNNNSSLKVSGISSVPNVISKSNYFLPVKNIKLYEAPNKIRHFKNLSLFTHRGESKKTQLYYGGERGTMWDFKIFTTLLREADKQDMSIYLSKKELFELLGIDSKQVAYIPFIIDSLDKFTTTRFRAFFDFNNEPYSLIFTLAKDILVADKYLDDEEDWDDRYDKTEKDTDMFGITFNNTLMKTGILDYFNNVDLNMIALLGKNQSALKLYSFLSAHQNEVQLTTDELVQLFNPEYTYDKYFLRDFKKRAVDTLHNLEFLDKSKIDFNSKTKTIHFKPDSFNTNTITQKTVRRNVVKKAEKDKVELPLHRRKKGTEVRYKLKAKEQEDKKATQNGYEKKSMRLLRKEDVNELYLYWKDDLKLKTHGMHTRALFEALTNIDKAIKGTLYLHVKQYKEFDRSYTKQQIMDSFGTFYLQLTDYEVEPVDKSFLQKKVTFQNFMLPNQTMIHKVPIPMFIQCLRPPQLVEKPFDESKLNDYVIAFAREKKIKLVDVSINDKKYLTKSLNQLKEVGFKFKKPPYTPVAVLQTMIHAIKKSKQLNVFEAKDLFYRSNPKNLLQSFEIYTKTHGYINQR